MSSVTIRIPDELRRELDKLSDAKGQPISDLVRESLRAFVAAERFRAIRSRTVAKASARGFVTDEDVFKAVS